MSPPNPSQLTSLNPFDTADRRVVDALHEQTQLCRSTQRRRLRVIGSFLRNPEVMQAAAQGWKPALDDKVIRLPPKPDSVMGDVLFEAALSRRQSTSRADICGQISMEAIGSVLSSLKATRQRSSAGPVEVTFDLRPYASAGAIYPCHVYLIPGNVEGLTSMPYRYDPRTHALIDYNATQGQFRDVECGVQTIDPPCAVVITANLDLVLRKYGSRGYRFALLEAGHIGQNVMLSAAACGLASLAYGSFYDRELEHWIGAKDAGETLMSVILLGGAHT